MARVWRGNGRTVTTTIYTDPDQYASALSRTLQWFTNPASASSRGPAPSRVGLPGFGVSRAAGYTQPLQNFHSAVKPILAAPDKRLGLGSGVSGQPGLPGTAGTAMTDSLAWMSWGQSGAAGMGS